jgi:hypothetical protein
MNKKNMYFFVAQKINLLRYSVNALQSVKDISGLRRLFSFLPPLQTV